MCPECGEEWTALDTNQETETESVIRDSAGNILSDGDTVAVIKDLKVKGRPTSIKV